MENIVGYTGRLGVNPTVYFESPDEFGRITQDHPHPDNVGRNKVRSRAEYKMENILDDDGFFHSKEEWKTGSHKSRNPFFNRGINGFAKHRLAEAIKKFPNIKPKYKNKT